ncbi:MAG: hypothetical protein FWE28_03530 [Oscillospiraceae bacterium]|nr:hypothetical protein [Oscillospiraceae bacterium]
MSKKEFEPKKQENKRERNEFDKYSNKYTRKRDDYLAGKPFRMHWGMLLFYIVPWILLFGVVYGRLIYHGIQVGIPLETLLLRWEVLPLPVIACSVALLLFTRMPRKIILEEDGFLFRQLLKKEHKILYVDIISYTFFSSGTLGISIKTCNQKHSFLIDFVRFEYLRDELKLKVGEDKEVKPKFWPWS